MLNIISSLLLVVCLFQDDVPYRSEEAFNVKFELGFRKRSDPNADFKVMSPQVAVDRGDSPPLPYLKTTLEILKKDSLEVKFRILRDNEVNVAKRKIEPGVKVNVFSGFVDDIKDQIQGYHHTVYFLDDNGIKLNKIVIEFDDEGFYYVNGKKKGKI